MDTGPLRKLRLPLLFALLLGAAYAVAHVLADVPEGGPLELPSLRWLLAAFLAAVGVFAVQVVRFFVLDVAFLRAQGHRAPALVHAVVGMVLYFVLGLLIAGGVFDQSLTGAIATSAVASVVLGLALQETLGNFFAGISLQVERPFRIGDFIRVGEQEGRVEALNWRTTTIRTVDESRVLIPNGVVARDPLEVFARNHTNRRILKLSAPYEVAPRRVIGFIREAVNGVPGITEHPVPQVRLGAFDDSSVGYEVLYWVDDYMRVAGIDAQVRERVWYAFARNGISIPYPHQVQVNYVAPHVPAAVDGAFPAESPEGPVEERERWLGKVALFAPLTPEEKRRLAERSRTLLFGPGEQILRCGGEGGSMFVVLHGRVEIRAPKPDGRFVRVAEIAPGEVFGEMSLLTGEARSADAWALDEVGLMEVRKAEMGEVLASNAPLAEALSRQASTRLDERSEAFAQASVEEAQPVSQASLLQKIRRFFDLC
jgi:small-conductance mechanosensitive channel/CRP-like cAMP-binding protein